MTRIACSQASCDISVYYVAPLVGLGESFSSFFFSFTLDPEAWLYEYIKQAKTA